jgi:hypothetical protein
MHASTSTAARTASAIAAVESVSECFAVWVTGCPPTTTALTVVLGTAVVATGGVAGAVAVVEELVVVECTLADAGIGKVDVELVGAGICG